MMINGAYRSRTVKVGNLEIGGDRPVRVQSMTNTETLDTAATVKQVTQLAGAGCELVRIAAQNLKEAHHLRIIREELNQRGIRIPLAADIHYLPEAAEVAARFVEKVRINPGNYSDKKRKVPASLSYQEYEEELERIAERLYPLLDICREKGTAIRIGTNHGSLSDRISYRYGNTPEGMVESALEFARICRDRGFHDLVISMKASNVNTVLHSNRLLVARMMDERMDYPIHLGVTEAGEGEDGRIKSAVGIGVLLSEGIGDTIRVSLTEDPVMEIPYARKMASLFRERNKRKPTNDLTAAPHPFQYGRHHTKLAGKIGGQQPPYVFAGSAFPTPESSTAVINNTIYCHSPHNEKAHSIRKRVLEATSQHPHLPTIIHKDLGDLAGDELLIRASIDLGMALTDGFGDGLVITGGKGLDELRRKQLAMDILQATGRRISKTEYIACPSCGRTQFDIRKALKAVKEKTTHLVGLKIAVMGCVVNGPGEMTDADYGYVGAGHGKVNIYKGQELVKRNVPEEIAVNELLKIINHPSSTIHHP